MGANLKEVNMKIKTLLYTTIALSLAVSAHSEIKYHYWIGTDADSTKANSWADAADGTDPHTWLVKSASTADDYILMSDLTTAVRTVNLGTMTTPTVTIGKIENSSTLSTGSDWHMYFNGSENQKLIVNEFKQNSLLKTVLRKVSSLKTPDLEIGTFTHLKGNADLGTSQYFYDDINITTLNAENSLATTTNLTLYSAKIDITTLNTTLKTQTEDPLVFGKEFLLIINSGSDLTNNVIGTFDARISANTINKNVVSQIELKGTSALTVNTFTTANSTGTGGRVNFYNQSGTVNTTSLKIGSHTQDKNFNVYLGESAAKALGTVELTKADIKTGNLYVYSASTTFGTLNLNYGSSLVKVTGASSTLTKVNLGAGATLEFDKGNATITTLNLTAGESSTLGVNGGTLTVNGVLDMGTISNTFLTLNAEVTSDTASKSVYSVYGIQGGTSSAGTTNRISTNYSAGSAKAVEILIKGDGTAKTYTFSGRIHDLGDADNPASKTVAPLSITMDAVNTTQYLAGSNYIRGLTTIKNGTLYVSSEKSKNTDPEKQLWLSNVSLEGGAFGACASQVSGSIAAIGVVKAKDLTWSGGILMVDLDAGTSDQVLLSGNFYNGLPSNAHVIHFDWADTVDLTDKSYEIVTWVGGTDFIEENFSATLKSDDYKVTFRIEGKSLWADFTAIPEPSTYAAIFGAVALLLALRRKRKA